MSACRRARPRLFECDLIVNAGGASRRMGIDKALLDVPPDGTPLIRYIIQRLAGIVSGQTFVITNDSSLASKAGLPSFVHLVPDDYPGTGALGGLATGLARCSAWAIALACDMPMVDPGLFSTLASLTDNAGHESADSGGCRLWDAVVPVSEGCPQPLHALYHRCCLPAMEGSLARGNLRIVDFYNAIHVRYVDESILRQTNPDLISLMNVNTPEEWQRALALFESDKDEIPRWFE